MLMGLTRLPWIQFPNGVFQCSANCGKGTRKRTVTCTNSQGKCDASRRPRAEEACEDYSGCYEWKTGSWSKVSAVHVVCFYPPWQHSDSGHRDSALPWTPM